MFYSYTCRKCGEVKWKDKTAGPTAAYNHLIQCYGTEDDVEQLYMECRKRIMLGQGASITSFLKASKATPREEAVHGWIKLIVNKSLPVIYVEDEEVREFSRHEVPLSARYLNKVIFKLVELVEKAIGEEMKQSPIGAIMHDGWSKVSTHYFGLYACYSHKVGNVFSPRIALLAVAPIQETSEEDSSDDDDDDDSSAVSDGKTASVSKTAPVGKTAPVSKTAPVGETATFNADAHCGFIRKTFEYYDVDFDSWCVAQICDNTSVNRSIAVKLDIKHIGCKSHQLALDVKDMLKEDTASSKLLDQVHETMISIKKKEL